MAFNSDYTLASFNPNSSSSIPPRKYSAPLSHYQSTVTSPPHAYLHRSGSLLPMPPNYNEGSCWTLGSLSSLNPSPLEIRTRKISVEVTKISLRMDGRWAQEKPYVIEKTWDEWLEIRERLVQKYPETESVLPKLSKPHGFLESIFTNSKRSNNTQSLNVKELNNFLSRLLTKCSKKVLNSSIVQNFFQTEEMRAGAYQVQYTDDDLPGLRRAPITADVPPREEATSIASHLQAFRFPEPTAVQSDVPSNVNLETPYPVGSECEVPAFNEKLSPRYRGRRATDQRPSIDDRVPSPHVALWLGAKGRSLGNPTSLLTQKSRSQIRPNTAFTHAAPVAPPKRPNTSNTCQNEVIQKHAVKSNAKPLPSSVAPQSARRPSENLRGYSREAGSQKLSRPQLREFKSMQDIRASAGTIKANGKSGRNGWVDSARNNSVPAVGHNPPISNQVRSPTNPWRRHRRTPSDSSSSFGSSQLSPISSVLSSPTITPSTSTHALFKAVSNQRIPPKIASRRSVDSLGPNSISREHPTSLRLTREHENGTTFIPQVPCHPIPPHFLATNPIAPQISQPTTTQYQRRPHTSAENVKGVVSNAFTLKVTHPESKTNIILPIQRELCSLPQIKSKIQNKMKLAGDIDLNPNWKIKLMMVDQEEIVRRDEFGNWKENDHIEDDGSKLVELLNQSQNISIKKITLRIY